MPPTNTADIETIFGLLNREVWLVTAQSGEKRGGLVATWVSQASLDPEKPVVIVGLATNHFTAELVASSRAFALHLISADQIDLAWRFGLASGRDRDKLAGLKLNKGASGSPILADSLAWLDCRVIAKYDTGDRLFFWANVLKGEKIGDAEPLREKDLFAAATAEQLAALVAAKEQDIATQSPLFEQWRNSV